MYLTTSSGYPYVYHNGVAYFDMPEVASVPQSWPVSNLFLCICFSLHQGECSVTAMPCVWCFNSFLRLICLYSGWLVGLFLILLKFTVLLQATFGLMCPMDRVVQNQCGHYLSRSFTKELLVLKVGKSIFKRERDVVRHFNTLELFLIEVAICEIAALRLATFFFLSCAPLPVHRWW